MIFPDSFFEKEIRDDFEVPELMKRAWSAAVEVLEVVSDICKKHDIKWFADWGTLLGTIRHKGFIPWDDDIDICMLREDYDRFIQAASTELPEGFVIAGMYADDKRLQDAAQVQQLRIIADENYWNLPKYMNRFHGFPCFRIGIDIFPIDYINRDKKIADAIYEKYYYLMKVLTHWDSYEKNNTLEAEIAKIEEMFDIELTRDDSLRNTVWRLSDILVASTDREDADYATNFFFDCIYEGKMVFDKHDYDTVKMLPFESFEMPVPNGYDDILSAEFGDYMTPVRSYDTHDYPFYRNQAKELEKMLKESGIDRSLTEFCRNWVNVSKS